VRLECSDVGEAEGPRLASRIAHSHGKILIERNLVRRLTLYASDQKPFASCLSLNALSASASLGLLIKLDAGTFVPVFRSGSETMVASWKGLEDGALPGEPPPRNRQVLLVRSFE